MSKTLLFPTDFSPQAHNAFLYALHLAEDLNAKIILFHAYHYTATGSYFLTPDIVHMVNEHRKEEALAEMQKYAGEAREESGKAIDLEFLLREGMVLDEIQKVTTEQPIDMVVMGTKGAGNRPEALIGSISAKVVDQCSTPVLVIPENAIYKPIRHIAYATNFEEKDLSLPPHFVELAKVLDAKISCVHISKESERGWDQLMLFIHEEVMRLDLDEDRMELFLLTGKDVFEGLEKFVTDNHVDLLAMLTHHHNLFDRLFGKSITHQAALHTHVPLLAYHK